MNKVLRRITLLVGILWLLSASALDSSSEAAIILCSASTVYLCVVGYATNWFDDFFKDLFDEFKEEHHE